MLIDNTIKEQQQQAYIQGWQDAVPNFGDEDDNKEESQG
jgi:hypothetical protein